MLIHVAAYCRVSTDQLDQANSFEAQKRYFKEYIERQRDWSLYEVYADEGITGTSTKKRTQFNRMIQDARTGKFQLILTKEVSRFSRNILDTIAYTRELKALGVGVLFVNDGINTLDPDAELRLSIMGSIAQEESRKTSSRVKWGQTRQMEQGVVFGHSLLGYDVQAGRMTVNPAGAEVVRLIFRKYVQERKGAWTIARELQEAGIPSPSGRTAWRGTVVLKILRNEKYCGDLKQKKTFTPDYLTHQKKYNHGEEAFVFLRDHHVPIVDRETWEEAQQELSRRSQHGKRCSGHGTRFPLSGKIQCGLCGRSFVSRGRTRKDGTKYRTWRCGTAGCDVGYQLRDDTALELLRQAVSALPMDWDALIQEVTGSVLAALERSGAHRQADGVRLKKELAKLREKKTGVLDAYFSKQISAGDMKLMNEEYDRRIVELTAQIDTDENESEAGDPAELTAEIRAMVEDIVSGHGGSDRVYGRLLERITVYPGKRLEVKLKHLPQTWVFSLERTFGPAVH